VQLLLFNIGITCRSLPDQASIIANGHRQAWDQRWSKAIN